MSQTLKKLVDKLRADIDATCDKSTRSLLARALGELAILVDPADPYVVTVDIDEPTRHALACESHNQGCSAEVLVARAVREYLLRKTNESHQAVRPS